MSNEHITPETLENISKVIAILTAADSFKQAEFEDFVYSLIDDDVDEAFKLLTGVIGFFLGMADSLGVDMKTSLENFGIAAQTQLLQAKDKEDDN